MLIYECGLVGVAKNLEDYSEEESVDYENTDRSC